MAAPVETDLDRFVLSQARVATQAEARGHWAAAALAWEAASLVRPDDRQAIARLNEARLRIDRLSAERQLAAEAAQRRGDWDAATLSYLDVLALDPTRRSAADALRQIERERNRRSMVGRFTSPTMAVRRSPADGEPAPPSGDSIRSANTLSEHATLLSGQGDLDGAIQMLRDSAGRNQPATRSMLAELYVQKAESLMHSQPDAARAAVEAALAIDRRHPMAKTLLQQLSKTRTRPREPSGPTSTPAR